MALVFAYKAISLETNRKSMLARGAVEAA